MILHSFTITDSIRISKKGVLEKAKEHVREQEYYENTAIYLDTDIKEKKYWSSYSIVEVKEPVVLENGLVQYFFEVYGDYV